MERALTSQRKAESHESRKKGRGAGVRFFKEREKTCVGRKKKRSEGILSIRGREEGRFSLCSTAKKPITKGGKGELANLQEKGTIFRRTEVGWATGHAGVAAERPEHGGGAMEIFKEVPDFFLLRGMVKG